MTIKVTEHGLLIPKNRLQGVDEVEIRREHNIVIITPTASKDPIWELGRHPVAGDINDASINHDKYL